MRMDFRYYPPAANWSVFSSQLTEIYELLRDHYVEDDDNMFRFDYSREFLRWYAAIETTQ